MAKYCRLSSIIDAVQWVAGDPLPFSEKGDVKFHSHIVIEPGDWLVVDAEGRGWVFKPSVFESLYVPIGTGCNCGCHTPQPLTPKEHYLREATRADIADGLQRYDEVMR